MKIRKIAGAVAATAIMFSIGAPAPASAADNMKLFGTQETLIDYGLGTEIGYTVTGLMPSADVIPSPVGGRLYEATVTAEARKVLRFMVQHNRSGIGPGHRGSRSTPWS